MSENMIEREIYQILESLLNEAQELEQNGDTESARSSYQQIIDTVREQDQAALDRSWEALLGDAEAGMRRLDASEYVHQGEDALRKHEYLSAAGAFRRAISRLGSDDPEASQGLAVALFHLGQQSEVKGEKLAARDYYEEALKYDPDQLGARQALLSVAQKPVSRRPSSIMAVGLLVIAALGGIILVWVRSPARQPKLTPMDPTTLDHATTPTSLTALPSVMSLSTVITTEPVVMQTTSHSPLPEISPVASVTAPTTATAVPPLSLTFSGSVLSQDGRPLARLRYIQLYGSETGDLGTRLLSRAITTDDGEFSLATAEDFPYYILWLELTPLAPQMKYVSVSAGRGGEAAGTRAIRYRHPDSGVYDNNRFYVAFHSPTPTYTPRPTATETPSPFPTPFPMPILLSPEEGATASDQVTFEWEWRGSPLPTNHAFEVRLWKDGQPDHYGAAETTLGTRLPINLEGAYGVSQGGAGRYYWTVAVVKLEPYERVGLEAPPRTIDIGGQDSPSPPTR